MFADYFLNLTQLFRVETKITREADRIQPKLGRKPVAINMNMRRFIRLMTVK